MNEICRICLEKCTDLNEKIQNYIDVIKKVCQIEVFYFLVSLTGISE